MGRHHGKNFSASMLLFIALQISLKWRGGLALTTKGILPPCDYLAAHSALSSACSLVNKRTKCCKRDQGQDDKQKVSLIHFAVHHHPPVKRLHIFERITGRSSTLLWRQHLYDWEDSFFLTSMQDSLNVGAVTCCWNLISLIISCWRASSVIIKVIAYFMLQTHNTLK